MKLICRTRLVALVGIALLFGGCVVPKLYEWSPDGKWMMVLTGDDAKDMLIADSDGHVLPARLQGVTDGTWFPDSHHLLVARLLEAKTWEAAAHLFSADQIKSITDAAVHLDAFARTYDWKALNADSGDQFWKQFMASEQQAKHDVDILNSQPAAVVLYFRDHADDAARAKIPAARRKELAELSQTYIVVQVCTFDPANITVGPTLMMGLDGIADLRVSPTGGNVMIAIGTGQALWLAPADGSAPAIKVADQAASYPDFSPDGRNIAFVRPSQSQEGSIAGLGTLSRMLITHDDGKLIKTPASTGPATQASTQETGRTTEDLVGLIYSPSARVRWLKDGRIIFSGVQVTLPVASQDMPSRPELFAFTPGKQAVVSRLLPRQAVDKVGDCAEYFEMSPDGTHVSIPDSSGKVDVVDLGSGDVTAVQDKPTPLQGNQEQGGHIQTVPVWRSADELAFIAPERESDKGADHTKVVLWSLSKNTGKTLSNGWAAATQPASAPAMQASPATSPTP